MDIGLRAHEILMMMVVMVIPRRRGLLGRLMVNSCILVGDCGDRFLMRTPYCILDRQRFGMRIDGMLAVSAPCVFPLRLYISLPQTLSWLFSLISTSCFGLRPSAAMSDG